MSAVSDSKDYRIHGGPWAGAWKIAAGVGALGIAASLAGFASNHQRFAFSYLFAFAVFLTIGLGSLFIVLLQYLVSARWSVTVRRTAEFFMSALPVFALLFVPIALSVDELYPWAAHHGGSHAAAEHAPAAGHGEAAPEHGAAAPAAHGEHGGHAPGQRLTNDEIEHREHSSLLGRKEAYLNKPFFFVRAVLYFLIWTLLAMRFWKNSTAQDTDKGAMSHTLKSQGTAPWGLPLFGLSLTFAAFDWYMSLLPQWYSTIFGVWFFAASVVSAFSVLILTTLALRSSGLTGNAISREHYHDLGKLLFGFNVFWAYISFSQFFLIWYVSIPEETLYFHMRWSNGPWKPISLAIIVLHFVVPFLVLISRNAKRKFNQLPMQLGAALLLTMHVVEMYWLVMPNLASAMHVHPSSAEALSFHWLDLTCLLGVGGVYLAVVLRQMANNPLIPVGDPRLSRSLHFENA